MLRYNFPNRHKKPEFYAHHLLFMFYLFMVESELKSGELPSYFAKLNELGLINIIYFNKALTEPFSDLVDETFLHFRAELCSNFDSYAQQLMIKQSKINLKVAFRFIVVLMDIIKLMVILRHTMQKSETTVWPINFMMMTIMPKLGH